MNIKPMTGVAQDLGLGGDNYMSELQKKQREFQKTLNRDRNGPMFAQLFGRPQTAAAELGISTNV